MISVASVNAIDTGDGLAMLDTGGQFDIDHVFDQVRGGGRRRRCGPPCTATTTSTTSSAPAASRPRRPSGGWPPPVVYAHEDLPDHFRRYERTLGWNTAINQRQFALPVDTFAWPADYRYPDVTYRDHLTFTQGGLTFELHHARGETDDATWTFVPELKALHPGDLFIWAVPERRQPAEGAALRQRLGGGAAEMAGCGAEMMLCGHGLPIFGADRVRQALTDTAELLDTIEAQTLALMNRGVPLDRVLHEVEVPEHLRELPYLQPVYDHPQFLVRNVWRRYGGWYDGEPDNLLPAPRAEQAGVGDAGRRPRGRARPGPRSSPRRRPPPGLPPRRVRRAVRARRRPRPTRCGPRSTPPAAASRCRRWPATSSATPPTPAAKAAATSPATTTARDECGPT